MIINSSNRIGGDAPPMAAQMLIRLGGDFDSRAAESAARIQGNLIVSGTAACAAAFDFGFDERLALAGDFICDSPLILSQPPPIARTLPADAFGSRLYRAELLERGVPVDISSFAIKAPKNAFGVTVSVSSAPPGYDWDAEDARFTFRIGRKFSRADDFAFSTILTSARLVENNRRLSWSDSAPGDQLTFGVSAPLADTLNRAPLRNTIFFDPRKISVSVSEIERIADTTGEFIETVLRPVPTLTLYKLLEFAFVENCGFTRVTTNIPNYEIPRCEFTVEQSFYEAIAPFIGVYEPLAYAVGQELQIVSRVQDLPLDFTPRVLTPANFLDWEQSVAPSAQRDGVRLQFISASAAADAYRIRTEVSAPRQTGADTFNSLTTIVSRRFRDYFDSDAPGIVLDSLLERETRETTNWIGVLISRTETTNSYDYQGNLISCVQTDEARVPDVSAGDADKVFRKTSETKCQYEYQTHPFDALRKFVHRIVTTKSALTAIDAQNQQLGEDYKSNYLTAYRAGNLAAGMRSEFAPTETRIETFDPLPKNQTNVTTERYDHLSDTPAEIISEIRAGDVSLGGIGGAQKSLYVWRTGLSASARPGYAPEVLNVGEIPLKFARPLARRLLEMLARGVQRGAISLAGFDEAVERGVIFRVAARGGEILGTFICEGYEVTGTDLGTPKQRIITRLEVTQI